jgi:hypothetical protein
VSGPLLRRSVVVVVAVMAVAAIWGAALPALLRCGPIARHVAAMEARGVNPAAMYYTELERLPVRPGWLERRVAIWP